MTKPMLGGLEWLAHIQTAFYVNAQTCYACFEQLPQTCRCPNVRICVARQNSWHRRLHLCDPFSSARRATHAPFSLTFEKFILWKIFHTTKFKTTNTYLLSNCLLQSRIRSNVHWLNDNTQKHETAFAKGIPSEYIKLDGYVGHPLQCVFTLWLEL